MCVVAETSQAWYISNQDGKRLHLLDQVCFGFMQEVLLGHLQPLLVKEWSMATLRTTFQLILTILDHMNARNMVKTLHQFMFGISKNKFEEKVKNEDQLAKDILDKLDDEPIDLLNDSKDEGG